MSNKEVVIGIRAVKEAVMKGEDIDKVLINKALRGENFNELLNTLRYHQVPFQFVPIQKLDHISKKNHQGVIAFTSPITLHKFEDVVQRVYEEGEVPLIFILDNITDIRNFGALSRTAECAGAHALIIPEKGSARISSEAIKSSAGALFHIPICRVQKLKETIQTLRNSGIQIIAATEKAADLYYSVDMTIPTAIIMGSEDQGIHPDILRIVDKLVRIPIKGKIESLNVAVAGAIMAFEAVRQRGDS